MMPKTASTPDRWTASAVTAVVSLALVAVLVLMASVGGCGPAGWDVDPDVKGATVTAGVSIAVCTAPLWGPVEDPATARADMVHCMVEAGLANAEPVITAWFGDLEGSPTPAHVLALLGLIERAVYHPPTSVKVPPAEGPAPSDHQAPAHVCPYDHGV